MWTWIVHTASDFSALTMDADGFACLSEGQRHDLASQYMASMGVDGESFIFAQGLWLNSEAIVPFLMSASDQGSSKFEAPPMLEGQIKQIVASILASPQTDAVINALSMPSSASHPDMDIYR